MFIYWVTVWFWSAVFALSLALNVLVWLPRRVKTAYALGPSGVHIEPCDIAQCELRKRLNDCMIHRSR